MIWQFFHLLKTKITLSKKMISLARKPSVFQRPVITTRSSDYLIFIGYYGPYFRGLQIQTKEFHDDTVQNFIINALGNKPKTMGFAGRTDIGVNAAVNVILVKQLSIEREYLKKVNYRLPKGLLVHCAVRLPDDFFSSFDYSQLFVQRSYTYTFPSSNNETTLEMEKFLNKIKGIPLDYRNLCKWDLQKLKQEPGVPGKMFTKIVDTSSKIERCKRTQNIQLNISQKGFLQHQIRYLVTVLKQVLYKQKEPDVVFDQIFSGITNDSKKLNLLASDGTSLMKLLPKFRPEVLEKALEGEIIEIEHFDLLEGEIKDAEDDLNFYQSLVINSKLDLEKNEVKESNFKPLKGSKSVNDYF